jgi:hypothetical protein
VRRQTGHKRARSRLLSLDLEPGLRIRDSRPMRGLGHTPITVVHAVFCHFILTINARHPKMACLSTITMTRNHLIRTTATSYAYGLTYGNRNGRPMGRFSNSLTVPYSATLPNVVLRTALAAQVAFPPWTVSVCYTKLGQIR